MSIANFLQELKTRDLYKQCTDLKALESLDKEIVAYTGFDLTGPGLHVGHLSTLMALYHLLNNGQKVIIILGGSTTYIGDPTGKQEMRKMLSPEEIKSNKQAICGDILQILSNAFININNPELRSEWINKQKTNIDLDNEIVLSTENGRLLIVDNYYWLSKLSYLDFLQDVGIHFSANKLFKMDTFEQRLSCGKALSFMELNYPLMQAYDFYYLAKTYGCNMQIGGSDQWGNILQGVELIHHMHDNKTSKKVFGLTLELLETADGRKMGKTEKGAIWINPEICSSQDFKNYFLNLPNEAILTCFKRLYPIQDEYYKKIFSMPQIGSTVYKEISVEIGKKLLLFISYKNNSFEASILGGEAINKQLLELIIDNHLHFYNKNEDLVSFLARVKIVSSKSEAILLIKQGGIKMIFIPKNSLSTEITPKPEVINENFILSEDKLDRIPHNILIGKKKKFFIYPSDSYSKEVALE